MHALGHTGGEHVGRPGHMHCPLLGGKMPTRPVVSWVCRRHRVVDFVLCQDMQT